MLALQQPVAGPSPPPVEAAPAPLRVVIADDHPLYRDGIARALEASGAFTVVAEASDGATALGLIRSHRPDVALLDVRMPKMDGIDVVAALARFGPAVPVVLLSAFDDEPVVTAGLEAGAVGFVSKTAPRDAICREVADAAAARGAGSPSALHGAPDLEPRRPTCWAPRLTAHEHTLLQMSLDGLGRSELAMITGFDEPTLRRQLDRVLGKLGADDLPSALATAVALGIVR